MCDFCWRADTVSFEPEPSVLYDLFMPTLLFSRVPPSPWRMNIKVEMGIFRFFCLPYFSPYCFLVPLFTFVPFYFHCLFLAKFRPSGHWCWSYVYPTPSLSTWTSLTSLCLGPGISSSGLSSHLCLSHCWLALCPF